MPCLRQDLEGEQDVVSEGSCDASRAAIAASQVRRIRLDPDVEMYDVLASAELGVQGDGGVVPAVGLNENHVSAP